MWISPGCLAATRRLDGRPRSRPLRRYGARTAPTGRVERPCGRVRHEARGGLPARMGRGVSWQPHEDAILTSLVRQHGHRWRAVAESWPHGTRTQAQCRLRWGKIREAQGGSEAGSEAGDSCASLELAQPIEEGVLPSWDSVPRWRRPIAGLANGEHILAARYAPVRMAALELVALPANVRTLWCRRSWPQVIHSLLRADGQLGEAPTPCRPSHVWLIQALQLHAAAAPHTLLYCDLDRAERAWERRLRAGGAVGSRAQLRLIMKETQLTIPERDALGVVAYAGVGNLHTQGALPCIRASGHHTCWVGGPEAGGGFYANGEVAIMALGLSALDPQRQVARGLGAFLSPGALHAAAGDALSMAFACALVAGAARLLDGGLVGTVRTASLYAGAFSTIAQAIEVDARYRGIDRRVHRVFAAESDARRRACLRWLAPHDVLYSDAATAGSRQAPVDVLDWTPPCKCFSQAAVLASRAGDRRRQRPWERRRAAQKVMHRAGIALVRCIRRVAPRLVLCEQVAGLSTHHRRHSRLLLRRLMAAVPYAWYTVVADAVNYGAPHHRVREGTAGVRLDSLAAPPPAGSVGVRWWCSPCAGERRICKCRTPLRSWVKKPQARATATADAGCALQ